MFKTLQLKEVNQKTNFNLSGKVDKDAFISQSRLAADSIKLRTIQTADEDLKRSQEIQDEVRASHFKFGNSIEKMESTNTCLLVEHPITVDASSILNRKKL